MKGLTAILAGIVAGAAAELLAGNIRTGTDILAFTGLAALVALAFAPRRRR